MRDFRRYVEVATAGLTLTLFDFHEQVYGIQVSPLAAATLVPCFTEPCAQSQLGVDLPSAVDAGGMDV